MNMFIVINKCIKTMSCVFLILIVLNYIPIKFATKIVDTGECLVCKTEPKLGVSRWIAYKEDNAEALENDIFVYLIGNAPNKYLSRFDFDVDKFHKIKSISGFSRRIDNNFCIYGIMKSQPEEIVRTIAVTDWDIIYPIDRASWRRFITPKNYLSIYDFDLYNLVKSVVVN